MNLGLYAIIVMYETFCGLHKEAVVTRVVLVYATSALAFYILHEYFVLVFSNSFLLLFPHAQPMITSVCKPPCNPLHALL